MGNVQTGGPPVQGDHKSCDTGCTGALVHESAWAEHKNFAIMLYLVLILTCF